MLRRSYSTTLLSMTTGILSSRETEVGQRAPIRQRPSVAAGMAAALPQQKRLQPIRGLYADRHRVFTLSDHVPYRFVRVVGHIDPTALAGPMKAREPQAVPP